MLLILVSFNAGGISFGDSRNMWLLKSLPANIPYANLLLLNVAQAIIAIFLASDFLKRDKKLDTTETVYMRPVSNTEYVLGKTWGNLKVFVLLNLVVLLIALIFNLSAGVGVDWSAYPIYFFLISIPTLVFIMGLAFLLMSILKNQAITFVVLLGYIIGTLRFFQNKFYYLFDYMAFNIPLARSQEVGFANLQTVLTHRGIYLLLGIGFIFFTIFLLKRLPQSKKGTYVTLILGVLFVLSAVWLGVGYVNNILHNESQQKQMIALNNQYVTAPRLNVSKHHIQLKQLKNGYQAVSEIAGKPNKKGEILVFSLNSGLKVQEVIQNNKKLKFERKKHLLLVHFPQLF
ncbi:MAG: xanthan lyase, partial [Draconibacterium sp.]